MNNNSPTKEKKSLPARIADLYIDGFRQMTVGRSLWALIIIKVLVLFGVFKLLFFPDVLKSRYDNDADRAQAVRHELVGRE